MMTIHGNIMSVMLALSAVILWCAPGAVAATDSTFAEATATVDSNINGNNPNVLNCTWLYVDQPLDHFARGANNQETFKQRVCVNDKFLRRPDGPVFFYAGNEAPVDVYVNNTGLMWDLAPRLGALVVFAEHRFFGESVPQLAGKNDCLSTLTATQALADFATTVRVIKAKYELGDSSKVVAFGGSYGGMLAAWFRFKYPHVCTGGAIAASAPVLGFPGDHPPLDGGQIAITRAASEVHGGTLPGCQQGILAVWPLIAELSKLDWGLAALSKSLNLCSPMRVGSTTADPREEFAAVIEYLQSVFFLLAEGNYPFPTNYITFGSLDTLKELQGWPMRAVCAKVFLATSTPNTFDASSPKTNGGLRKGHSKSTTESIHVEGHPEKVKFDVVVNDKLRVSVDWQESSSNLGDLQEDDLAVQTALKAVKAIGEAVNVFYNVSGTVKCNDIGTWGPDMANKSKVFVNARERDHVEDVGMRSMFTNMHMKNGSQNLKSFKSSVEDVKVSDNKNGGVCSAEGINAMAAWGAIVCNEEINLVQYLVKGTGRDMFWPPTIKQGTTDAQVIAKTLPECASFSQSNPGLAGVYSSPDPFAPWADTIFGNRDVYKHGSKMTSRIAFSNGLFDPWSAAGVLPAGLEGYDASKDKDPSIVDPDGISLLIIPDGGHHNDLFFAHKEDTKYVRRVRRQEEELIAHWVRPSKDDIGVSRVGVDEAVVDVAAVE